MITIGIPTYNRLDSLRTLISQLKTHTKGEWQLIVSVDGSTDGTVEYLRGNRINHIFSENRGVGHAKNLLMWWFFHKTKDDILIMMEDDCRVWEDNWSEHWVYIANYYKYVNFYEGQQTDETKLFNISPCPLMVKRFGAAVMAIHREVIEKVGYLDPSLPGYGFEHVEWTARVYQTYKDLWQGDENCVPGYNQHVGVVYENSYFKGEQFIQNWRKAVELLQSGKPVYRMPFSGGVFGPNISNYEDWCSAVPWGKRHFLECIDGASIYTDPIPDLCAGQICPLCGFKGKHIGERDGYPIRECCGILLSFPWKNRADYEKLYTEDSEYHVKEQEHEGQKAFWDRDLDFYYAAKSRLALIRCWYKDAKSLLDIGAGTGAMVEVARSVGMESVGVEINKSVARAAAARGRNVYPGSVKNLIPAVVRYDVITMFDVFEHLTDPADMLKKCQQLVTPGGLLVIEMPEVGSPEQNRDGLNWKHIRPRQHICLYSDHAAQALFKRHGWRVEAMHRPMRGGLSKACYFLSVV